MALLVWQVSLVWAGEVIAIRQQHGPLEQHAFWRLLDAPPLGHRLSAAHGYRLEAGEGRAVVLAERVRLERGRGTLSARHEAVAALVTLLIAAFLGACTLIPPRLASVEEDPVDREPWRLPRPRDVPERAPRGALWRADLVAQRGGARFRFLLVPPVVLAPSSSDLASQHCGLAEPCGAPGPPAVHGVARNDPLRQPTDWPATLAPRANEGMPEVSRQPAPPGPLLARASWHTVRPGETLGKIARKHGFDCFLDLYNERLNPELLRRRPDPDRIFPGDRVRIPR